MGTPITTAGSGVGITLGYEDSGGSSYTTLAQLKDDCGFDGFETATIEITTLGQGVVYKAPGRTDNGTFSGSLYLIGTDAGVAKLHSLFAAKTTESWQVTLNDETTPATATSYTFQGFLSTLKPANFTGTDAPTLEFTIAISGPVTRTPAS